jgi:hypothetical protein
MSDPSQLGLIMKVLVVGLCGQSWLWEKFPGLLAALIPEYIVPLVIRLMGSSVLNVEVMEIWKLLPDSCWGFSANLFRHSRLSAS